MARQYFKIYFDEVDSSHFHSWSKAMLLVWICLKRYENKNHAAWPGYRRIQQFTGLAHTSIRRAISELEYRGAIQTSKAGRNNYYMMQDDTNC